MTVDHHPQTWTPARFRIPELCVVCGDEAEYLCDAVIAIRPQAHFDEAVWTCDAPLCLSCRVMVRRSVIREGEVMSVDRCPYHHRYRSVDRFCLDDCLGDDPDDYKRGLVIPAEHIDKFRGRIWRAAAADDQIARVRAKDEWCEEVRG